MMLAGVLQDRRVALVVLPGSDAAVAESTAATLRSSGAAVVSTTSVSEDWVSTDEATVAARDAAVQRPPPQAGVDVCDSGSVSPRDVLLAGLLAVPAEDPADDVVPAATATTALDDLAVGRPHRDRHRGLRARRPRRRRLGRGDPGRPARPGSRRPSAGSTSSSPSTRGRPGTLVAAEATTAGDGVSVIETVRNDATATKGVSTVDNAGGAMGQASVVHALDEQAAGDVGQYGLAAGADAPYAPIPAS